MIVQPAATSDRDVEALIREARRRQRKRRWLIALVVTAVVAIVVTLAGIGGGRPTQRSRARDHSAPVGAATQTLRIRWRVTVAAGVASVTLADGSLWVAGFGAVTRLDPLSGRTIARISVPTLQIPDVIGFDGRIWVSSGGFAYNPGTLYEIDPLSGKVARAFRVPGQPSHMTGGGGYLWVNVDETEGQVLRPFNPRTGNFLPGIFTSFDNNNEPSYGLDSLWGSSAEPVAVIWRLDPSTMQTSQFWPRQSSPAQPLSSLTQPEMVIAWHGWVWAAFDGGVARFDPATGKLEHALPITKTEGVLLQAGGSALWVLMQTGSSSLDSYLPDPRQPGRVALIDRQTGAFAGAPIAIGSSAGYDSFAANATMAWVGDRDDSTVIAVSSRAATSCSRDCIRR
jgi:hypothetical protein